MKPLFVPLKTEYYDSFANGSKWAELRLYGPRWNEKTCHVGDPISTTEAFPTMSVQLDMEDPEFSEYRDGIDVDCEIRIGLEVCRECHALIGVWLEDIGDAVFHHDWGREREANLTAPETEK